MAYQGAAFRFMPCRPCCKDCEACKGKDYPDELTLTLDGFANGTCTDCVNANGAFVVSKVISYYDPDEFGCSPYESGGVWISRIGYHAEYLANLCLCGGIIQGTLVLDLQIQWNADGIAGRRRVTATLYNTCSGFNVKWEKTENDQTDPFDCQAFSGLSLPFVSAEPATAILCDVSAATSHLST